MLSGKNLLVLGIILLILLSTPLAIYLVQKRTKLEAEAEPVAPTTREISLPTPSSEEGLSISDFSDFTQSYGKPNPKFDFNQNGVVDAQDFIFFKEKYGE